MANNLQRIDEFRSVLNDQSIRSQIKNSLKENSGAFMSSMIDLYSGDPYLQNCDPVAVAKECLKAATLKLPLVKSLGFAYVVPYNNVPTFTVGYKGYIQLAQRSGMYKNINADVVYEGELVGKNKLSGELDLTGEAESDKVVGYFCYFKLLNGFEKTLYMTKDEVEKYAYKYAPIYKKGIDNKRPSRTPWFEDFDKMALKTVIRQLIGKYGVMSTEMQEVMAAESQESKVQKEIDANANKQPLDFKEIEYEIDPEPATNEPSEAEKQQILAAEMAEAEADYGQPSFL